jgi:hypothetical protein
MAAVATEAAAKAKRQTAGVMPTYEPSAQPRRVLGSIFAADWAWARLGAREELTPLVRPHTPWRPDERSYPAIATLSLFLSWSLGGAIKRGPMDVSVFGNHSANVTSRNAGEMKLL